jgi:hypothetical protein
MNATLKDRITNSYYKLKTIPVVEMDLPLCIVIEPAPSIEFKPGLILEDTALKMSGCTYSSGAGRYERPFGDHQDNRKTIAPTSEIPWSDYGGKIIWYRNICWVGRLRQDCKSRIEVLVPS